MLLPSFNRKLSEWSVIGGHYLLVRITPAQFQSEYWVYDCNLPVTLTSFNQMTGLLLTGKESCTNLVIVKITIWLSGNWCPSPELWVLISQKSAPTIVGMHCSCVDRIEAKWILPVLCPLISNMLSISQLFRLEYWKNDFKCQGMSLELNSWCPVRYWYHYLYHHHHH